MEKYLTYIWFVGILINSLAIFYIFRVIRGIIKSKRELAIVVLEIALKQNELAYSSAQYILIDLQAKAKVRDLTDEEQHFFHEARKAINNYETNKKRQAQQQS